MFWTKMPSQLDAQIERALLALEKTEVGSEEYTKIVNDIVKLHKMKVDETPDFVSKDTAAVIGANILGILLIIRHEHVNVIASRAMNLVMKPK